MSIRVAIVGATGNVGRELLNILDERDFPADEVYAVASRRSKGKAVSFGDKELKCEAIEDFDFGKVDLVLMSAGGKTSKEWSPKIAAKGAIVIDNSSCWRMDPDVPLVVPEVNGEAVLGYDKKNIIANPNCSTAQLVLALKPIHDAVGIKRAVVSTYQSTSGAGKAGMDELWDHTKAVIEGLRPEPHEFTKSIAFNVIPQIGTFREDGYTDEEAKMWNETHKMIDPSIKLTVTCVRVPVFVGHSEAVHLELNDNLSPGSARKLLREAEGLLVVDEPEEDGFITPYEAQGEWATYISRVRRDNTVENGIAFWCVSDNLRKGAALNAIQIGEELIKRGVLKSERAALTG